MIPWLADEQWGLNLFQDSSTSIKESSNGRKPYKPHLTFIHLYFLYHFWSDASRDWFKCIKWNEICTTYKCLNISTLIIHNKSIYTHSDISLSHYNHHTKWLLIAINNTCNPTLSTKTNKNGTNYYYICRSYNINIFCDYYCKSPIIGAIIRFTSMVVSCYHQSIKMDYLDEDNDEMCKDINYWWTSRDWQCLQIYIWCEHMSLVCICDCIVVGVFAWFWPNKPACLETQ